MFSGWFWPYSDCFLNSNFHFFWNITQRACNPVKRHQFWLQVSHHSSAVSVLCYKSPFHPLWRFWPYSDRIFYRYIPLFWTISTVLLISQKASAFAPGQFSLFSSIFPMFWAYYNLGEWAIASHGMYKSALVSITISKQKNLLRVLNCWIKTRYFNPRF